MVLNPGLLAPVTAICGVVTAGPLDGLKLNDGRLLDRLARVTAGPLDGLKLRLKHLSLPTTQVTAGPLDGLKRRR